MSHSPETHKQYYRMQDSAIELSKVSRLLLAVDSGKGAAIKGKSLQDINENGMTLKQFFFFILNCDAKNLMQQRGEKLFFLHFYY